MNKTHKNKLIFVCLMILVALACNRKSDMDIWKFLNKINYKNTSLLEDDLINFYGDLNEIDRNLVKKSLIEEYKKLFDSKEIYSVTFILNNGNNTSENIDMLASKIFLRHDKSVVQKIMNNPKNILEITNENTLFSEINYSIYDIIVGAKFRHIKKGSELSDDELQFKYPLIFGRMKEIKFKNGLNSGDYESSTKIEDMDLSHDEREFLESIHNIKKDSKD